MTHTTTRPEYLGTISSTAGRIVSVYRLTEDLPDWALYYDHPRMRVGGPRNVALVQAFDGVHFALAGCCYEGCDGHWQLVPTPAGYLPYTEISLGLTPAEHDDLLSRAIHAVHGNWSA